MDALLNASAAVLAGCVLALVGGGFVKGVTGMGLPLVAAPVLASVIPVPQALALLTVPSFGTSLWQMVAGGAFLPSLRRLWPLLAGITVGIFASARLLATMKPAQLNLILGVIVVLFALVFFRRVVFDIRPAAERWISPVAGLVCGAIGGVSMFFGPVFVMYLSGLRLPKDDFICAVSITNVWCTLVFAVALAGYGLLDGAGVLASAVASIPVFAGLFAGQWLRRRVNESLFRRLLAVTLLVIGLNLIRRALTA